jgi:hypothetical protein
MINIILIIKLQREIQYIINSQVSKILIRENMTNDNHFVLICYLKT